MGAEYYELQNLVRSSALSLGVRPGQRLDVGLRGFRGELEVFKDLCSAGPEACVRGNRTSAAACRAYMKCGAELDRRHAATVKNCVEDGLCV